MSESTELAEEGNAPVIDGEHRRATVEMHVDGVCRLADSVGLVLRQDAFLPVPAFGQEVPAFPVPASAGRVDEAGRVVPLREIEHRMRQELAWLAPALVVGVPHHNAGERLEVVHHLLHLLSLKPVALDRLRLHRISPAASPARQVLYDEYAEPVAHRVVLLRLDLDVLAEHVEAAVLQHFDVILHRLLARRREESVGPPSLV